MPTPPLTAKDYQEIAARIRAMAAFGRSMRDVGLSRRATVALLVEATKLPKRDIETVLDGIEGLHNWVSLNGGA